jgi:2-haloacid dehalogenase
MKPAVLIFDVNETLSDLSALEPRFRDVGAEGLLPTWFAGVLRDGFALTVTGHSAPFREVAAGTLRGLLAGADIDDIDGAAEHILSEFSDLPLHPDIADGVRALRQAGLRLVTLSNGAAQVAEGLLGTAGLRTEFEAVLSVADAGRWKPDPIAYEYATRQCGVTAGEAMLVAVHPWDIHGAACAGLRTAWLQRGGGPYPDVFAQPDVTVASLPELATRLSS